MDISNRRLRNWRRAALLLRKAPIASDPLVQKLIKAVIEMTQEILDYNLTMRGGPDA